MDGLPIHENGYREDTLGDDEDQFDQESQVENHNYDYAYYEFVFINCILFI